MNRIRRRERKNTGAWTDESGRARACRGGRSLLQVGEGPSDFVNSPRGRRFAGVWAFGTDSGPVDKSVVLSVVLLFSLLVGLSIPHWSSYPGEISGPVDWASPNHLSPFPPSSYFFLSFY